MAAQPIGEAGSLTFTQTAGNVWQTVTLSRSYNNPVVVASLGSTNDAEPAEVRVRNVNDDNFQIQVDEWNYLDGTHGSETVNYLVMEAGSYTLHDGRRVDAGVTSSNHFFRSVTYEPFASTPVVIAQITSTNASGARTTRLNNISDSGFSVRVQNEFNNNVSQETVHWVAWDVGEGQTPGGFQSVGRANTSSTASSYTWPTAFDATPVTLVEGQTYSNSDVGHIRLTANDTTGTSFFFEEEQSLDTETTHPTESAGIVGLSAGVLYRFINTAPTAGDDSYTLDEDEVLTIGAGAGVLANDVDADVFPAAHVLTPTVTTSPSHGLLTLNADGSFQYTPQADYFGSDSFTYEIDDGWGGTDRATVTLTIDGVNDTPTASDVAFSLAEDDTLAVPLSALADDAEDDVLTFTLEAGPSHGVASLSASGLLSYTPDADFFGSDTLTYRITDAGGATSTARVDFTVNAVNDLPTLTGPRAAVADEQDALTVTLVAADVDAAGTYRLSLVADEATLSVTLPTGLTLITGTGTQDAALTVEGAWADLQSVLADVRLSTSGLDGGLIATLVDPASPSSPVVWEVELVARPAAQVQAQAVGSDPLVGVMPEQGPTPQGYAALDIRPLRDSPLRAVPLTELSRTGALTQSGRLAVAQGLLSVHTLIMLAQLEARPSDATAEVPTPQDDSLLMPRMDMDSMEQTPVEPTPQTEETPADEAMGALPIVPMRVSPEQGQDRMQEAMRRQASRGSADGLSVAAMSPMLALPMAALWSLSSRRRGGRRAA